MTRYSFRISHWKPILLHWAYYENENIGVPNSPAESDSAFQSDGKKDPTDVVQSYKVVIPHKMVRTWDDNFKSFRVCSFQIWIFRQIVGAVLEI